MRQPGHRLRVHALNHAGWQPMPCDSMIALGFPVQWPTLLTLAMFPVLTWMYVKLARHEEADARREFGDAYRQYAADVPALIPRLEAMRQKMSLASTAMGLSRKIGTCGSRPDDFSRCK